MTNKSPPLTPELDKFQEHEDDRDIIQQFVEWICLLRGVDICRSTNDGDPSHYNVVPDEEVESMVYEFLGFQKSKIDAERRELEAFIYGGR